MTDKIRVQHTLDAIAEIETYLTNVSLDDFFSNSEKRFATIKQIEIIGEACNHITNDIKQAHPEIEWISINACLAADRDSEIFQFMNILV